jgi:hypothetical protein
MILSELSIHQSAWRNRPKKGFEQRSERGFGRSTRRHLDVLSYPDLRRAERLTLPGEGCTPRTSDQITAAPGSRRGSVTRQPHGMTMQPPRTLPRLQRNIDPPPRVAVGTATSDRA